MTDEAEQTEVSEAPVALVKSTVVTQILGRVEAAGDSVIGTGAANNTRWVLDVEVKKGNEPVVIELLEYRSGRKLSPDLMSFSITPTSKSACAAHIWGEPKGGMLTLNSVGTGPYSYRVAVDVMHSANR